MSLIGGNCKQSPTNIILIPPNDIMLDFNLCNFKCIVASKMQTHHWYLVNNNELIVAPYVYNCVGFVYISVFINWKSQ